MSPSIPLKIIYCFFCVWGILFSELEIKYAQKFTLNKLNDHTWELTINGPYKGSQEIIKTKIIKKGLGHPIQQNSDQVIFYPIQSLISLSTVNLPHIVSLDEADSLIGVDSFQYINTREIIQKIEKQEVIAVGEFQNLNIERVLELSPDVVLTYTTGQAKYDTHHRLRKAGVPTLILASYLESSPLGRAEWIKLIGLLYDKVEQANRIFEEIESRYLKLCELTKGIKNKPTVFCNAPFGDTWYMPGGKSYSAQLMADAGADYLWRDNPEVGSVPLDFEKVFEKAHKADYWLVSSHLPWRQYEDVSGSDPRYKHFYAFQKKNMISNDKRVNPKGGNDIYEAGTLNPDLILKDYISIFHPELLKNTKLYFHRPLQ